jgi:hypothetical protein
LSGRGRRGGALHGGIIEARARTPGTIGLKSRQDYCLKITQKN